MASGQKLSLSYVSQSVAGEICMPNVERMNVNVWKQENIHNGDVLGASALISLSRQYQSIEGACAWTGVTGACATTSSSCVFACAV